MSDYLPVTEAAAVTMTAGANLTGGLLVKTVADDQVVHTNSIVNDWAWGISAHDAPLGGRVSVFVMAGAVHELPVEAGVTLAAGDGVCCSTTPGRLNKVVMSTSASVLGIVVRGTTGTVAGAKARVIGV